MTTKKAFYPNEEVEAALEQIPKGRLSSRINDLILKGLSFEQKSKIEQDYIRFNEEIGRDQARTQEFNGMSETMMMSAKAFESEDEEEDYI